MKEKLKDKTNLFNKLSLGAPCLTMALLTAFLLTLITCQPIKAETLPNDFLPHYTNTPFFGDLADMKRRRVIRALVTYSKTDFFIRHGKLKGMQVELLREFEDELNKHAKRETDKIYIKFVPVTFDQLIPSLLFGKGDIAAAFLSVTPDRQRKVAFTYKFRENVDEVLVTHQSAEDYRHLENLLGKQVYVLKGSSYQEHLKVINYQFRQQHLPTIEVKEADPSLLSEDILEMVNAGVYPATVVDRYKAELWTKVLPNIKIHHNLTVSTNNQLAWATRQSSPELNQALSQFIQEKARKGTFLGNALFRRYYKKSRWIKNTRRSTDKVAKLLPVFKQAADKYQFDVIALIAQSFQESGLNNNLVSDKGAVGIMQVMPDTASDMGIKNYRQLTANIEAGVRYLSWLRRHYLQDGSVSPNNQLAMLWAAYNAGPANLQKMRQRAEKMGLNKDVWFGNLELAANTVTGRETVQYVSNIYKYYLAYHYSRQLLQNKEAHKTRLTTAKEDS